MPDTDCQVAGATLARRVWRALSPVRRRQFCLLQLLSLSTGVTTLCGIAAIVPFFAVLADPALIHQQPVLHWLFSQGGFSDAGGFLPWLGAGFIAMVLLANAANLLSALAIDRFGQHLASELNVALFDEYLHRDYPFHAGTHSAQLASDILFESRRVAAGLVQGALTLTSSVFASLLIVASVFWMTPEIALAATAVVGGSYLLTYLLSRRRLRRNGALRSRHLGEQMKILDESLAAIKEILLLRNQRYFRDRFAASCAAIARTLMHHTAATQAPRYVIECVIAAGLIAAALWLWRHTAAGWGLAQLGFLGLASYRLLPTLQQAFTALAHIRADAGAFDRIESALIQYSRRVPPVAGNPGEWQDRPRRDIRVREVSFRYPGAHTAALRDVSLRITAGTMVGFVGANGSGKTTLADLILGLLAPDAGRIEIDGIELADANRAHWQSRLAYCPQNVMLLDASFAANIALGVAPADIDPVRLRQAARMAGVAELIESGTDGYGSTLGERGIRLSGGQRQKIGLARAWYRDARVIVLDEATSSLDGASEQEVTESLEAMRGERTLIVIAHRMATVRGCDVIHQFEDGALVASGDFTALSRESHGFRRLMGAGQ